jgi:hypothetical protein
MNRWFLIVAAVLAVGIGLIVLGPQPQDCNDIGGVARCGPLISPFLIAFVTILVVAFLCLLGLMRGSRDR